MTWKRNSLVCVPSTDPSTFLPSFPHTSEKCLAQSLFSSWIFFYIYNNFLTGADKKLFFSITFKTSFSKHLEKDADVCSRGTVTEEWRVLTFMTGKNFFCSYSMYISLLNVCSVSHPFFSKTYHGLCKHRTFHLALSFSD